MAWRRGARWTWRFGEGRIAVWLAERRWAVSVAMDLGWIVTFASPTNPTAQVSASPGKAPAGEQLGPYLSIEVGDVDSMHANALARGYEVVHPLTDESWGVRRFFVREPGGLVLNILGHTPLGEVPGGGGRGRAQGAGGRP